VQADFAIELGADDETLEFPWFTAVGQPRYFDLKRQPHLLPNIEEAAGLPELREFLIAVNSSSSTLETAKCDAWASNQINSDEEIFGAAGKFGGYVDFLFSDPPNRYSFPKHASAEFLLRRCYYHQQNSAEIREGFYITFYLFGYGEDEKQACQRWALALRLVGNAIRQLSASPAKSKT